MYVLWFGIFWLIAFIVTASEFVVIVSTCTWYFSSKEQPKSKLNKIGFGDKPGDAEVMKGFYWSWRYHCGSIAFGSLILAIVWAIRAVFEYMSKK
jgi:solute carrier family 44 (choline transporter-like protein), member 2/4/5